MLGSLQDAEDAVQETLLRAWRYRDSVKDDAPLRPWLYGVATNACLDAIARDERRAVLGAKAAAHDEWTGEPDVVVWLGPISNSVLEPTTPPDNTPEAITLMCETIESPRRDAQRARTRIEREFDPDAVRWLKGDARHDITVNGG